MILLIIPHFRYKVNPFLTPERRKWGGPKSKDLGLLRKSLHKEMITDLREKSSVNCDRKGGRMEGWKGGESGFRDPSYKNF